MIPHIHDAIRALHPEAINIYGDVAYDEAGNEVEYDKEAAEAKLIELFAEYDTQIEADKEAKKASLSKLAKLGLTPDDLKNILG